MAPLLPITLSGDNLGQRHRYLNSQVNQAASSQVSFHEIENLTEQSAVDRLFKIDLANKLKHVEYIIKCIKDDDMLFVSRALKCKWLLEHRDIINPKYLEDVLFPQMIMPAITKMKHWLYINLHDPKVCLDFYQYYKEKKFEFAVKFLSHCDNIYILNEFPNIMVKLTPHVLKVLGEKNPKLITIYFESLATNEELIKRYLNDEQKFYNVVKYVLKSDPDSGLNIIEKYHIITSSNKLSPAMTHYIINKQKNRFMAKLELYIAHLLHIPTVALQLSAEECQEVIIKLARADYLSWWFSYANVEALVKRVGHENRAAFKKKVFVNKDVGEHVSEWPYSLPTSPLISINPNEGHIFTDKEFEPIQMLQRNYYGITRCSAGRMLGQAMYSECNLKAPACDFAYSGFSRAIRIKTELEKLFDEFRFTGFEGTLHELKGRLGATSSADRRRDILLVLVSKSGGRSENIHALLQVASRLRNEPVHARAAVVRSLVKRANVWRLPQDSWDSLYDYAYGLGLDGKKGEVECYEGLHAVVLRQLITTGQCDDAVCSAFLENFSTFSEYKLDPSERAVMADALQRILIASAANEKPEVAAIRLGQLLDVLKYYNVNVASSPAVVAIASLAKSDLEAARPLLIRLYESRVGRRELLRQYLEFRHDDAALLNALRHDPDAVNPDLLIKIINNDETRADQYLLKVSVYFNESGGTLNRVREALLAQVALIPNVKLARPLATVAGKDMKLIWRDQDVAGGEHYKLGAALRANMHRARPSPDALSLGWRKAGMKAVAYRAMRCRQVQVTQVVELLLEERVKRTVRLALAVAQRSDSTYDIFSNAVKIRPLAALRAAILYFRKAGIQADRRIWDLVKPFISTVDLAPREGLRHILSKTNWLPEDLKPEYCAVMYLALDKLSNKNTFQVLSELMKCLPDVESHLLDKVLLRTLENMEKESPESYPAMVIRYLMLSKTDKVQEIRLEKIGEHFLTKLNTFHNVDDESKRHFFSQNVNQILCSLMYNFTFFDIKYEYCTQVFERILSWMQNIMPKEKYFNPYVYLHTTMLYYKAVRQSIKQKPEIFEDPDKKMSDGVEVVGFIFGKYIANELTELKSKYFDSIMELYRIAFNDYVVECFSFSSREKFLAAMIKGILSEDVGSASRLAVHIFHGCHYHMNKPVVDELKELLKQCEDKESQFFLYADILC